MIYPVGFFKLHRELFSKPIWLNSTLEQQVILITLIGMANFRPNQWEWEGKKFEVQPGQFITSANSIIENTGGRVTRQNVRSALKRFEKLDFLTIKSTKRGMLITIENWGKYQGDEDEPNQVPNQRVTNAQPTGNQQVTTKEEVKKERKKEGKNNKTSMVVKTVWENSCQTSDGQMSAQVRLGKDRLGKDNKTSMVVKDNNKESKTEKKTDNTPMVIKAYSELDNLPTVRKWTDKRKKQINARIQEYGLEEVINTLKSASRSEFLTSSIKANWYNADWIFNPNNFIKILEGKYNKQDTEERTSKYDLSKVQRV